MAPRTVPLPRVPRLFQVGTTPGRTRVLTALFLVTLTALCYVTALGMADTRDALRAVGDDEGPMVVATSDVSLALADMDAQVTNVLMTGGEDGWLCDDDRDGADCERRPPRFYYDARREDAQRAILQAARLAEGDPVRLRTVQSVLDGLQQYDRRVQATMELGARTRHAFENLPESAAIEYRAATALMTQDLLPKANNLTLDGAAIVDSTYREERSAILWGRARVIALGVAAVAVLLGLQIFMAVRFKRWVSPLLAVATVALVALVVFGASLLATEADRLRVAKEAGFDPVLTLSRTQSMGKSLDADRTRSLLDPADSDRYDQTYLEKSQAVFYIADVNDLESYYTHLRQRLTHYADDPDAVDFGGFYGGLAREAGTPEEHRILVQLMTGYRKYQDNDQRVRRLAGGGDRVPAARAHLDPVVVYLSHPAFRDHDQGLDAEARRHRFVTDLSVRAGEDTLKAWTWGLPASGVTIAALVVAGVWPRLREYLGTQPKAGKER